MIDEPQILTRPADVAALEPAWRRLALDTGVSFFSSPDWVLSWWETLGRDVPGRVAVWRDERGLAAVVPLGRVRERLHPRLPLAVSALTNLGGGPGSADHCGFAVTDRASDGVREWLAATGRRRTLLLHDLDVATAALLPDHAGAVRRSVCPYLRVPDDPEAIGGSARLRKALRGYLRRLDRDGVRFRWVPPGGLDGALLDRLFRLHAARADAASRRSTFAVDRRPLHDRLAARAGGGQGPAAVLAERDGEPVGMLYGFRWRDEFAYYQSGWQPELAARSLGTVLIAEAIRLAAADGARVFDFLRGPEPYKYRFGAVDRVDATYLLPRGPSGALLGLKYRVKGRERAVEAPARSGAVAAG